MLKRGTLAAATFAVVAATLALVFTPGAAKTDDPYAILRDAYARGDVAAAGRAYAENAIYTEAYSGAPPEERRGRAEIEKGFARTFKQLGAPTAERPIDLNFRFTQRQRGNGRGTDEGFYRIRVGRSDDPGAQAYYGSFRASHAGGVFVRDHSGDGSRDDFETAAGPVAFLPDEETLDPTFYDRLLGRYQDRDGCAILVTRSARRLMAHDECAHSWRGLTRATGTEWIAASNTVIGGADGATYRFAFAREGSISGLTVDTRRTLQPKPVATREAVSFHSGSVKLTGDILRPTGFEGPRPAVVMIHGSGPQDRHGYASIVEFIAMQFAREGFVVLSFDKRGVGGSSGNWAAAEFDDLASDVRAAAAYLRTRRDVRPDRIGYAGSSQAGWVAAKAIERGGGPTFVFLLGAAGAATTVEEQNIYNTRVRMGCAGISPDDISLALDQQRAFFAARKDPSKEKELASLTARAQRRAPLRDWLFPATTQRQAEPQWYDVLDPSFDPATTWAAYRGQALFVFSENDDSTETRVVTQRLANFPNRTNLDVRVLRGAQHLGLRANSPCRADLEQTSDFDPELWPTLRTFARKVETSP
jgi:alpha/beta superfamily hydrolase